MTALYSDQTLRPFTTLMQFLQKCMRGVTKIFFVLVMTVMAMFIALFTAVMAAFIACLAVILKVAKPRQHKADDHAKASPGHQKASGAEILEAREDGHNGWVVD